MRIKSLIPLFFICIVLVFISSQQVEAVTANPHPVEFRQPDGSTITLNLKGDEFIHWATTSDGYTIMSNKNGFYEYAIILSDGKLGFSGIQAHDPGNRSAIETNFTSRIKPGLFFSKAQITEIKDYLAGNNSPNMPAVGGFPTTGVRAHLMILANFNNTSTTYSQSNFDNLMNQVNYNGTGSFKDYYLEVSYGLLTVNSTVTIWVTLPHTHDYYGPQSKWGTFAYDAVVAADQQASVNYALYDNDADGVVDGVCIAHQGRGQEESGNTNDIWSHSWDLASAGYTSAQRTFDGVQVNDYTTIPEKGSATTMTTIGVMCHEFGHNLGAPDFYDTDYSTGGQYDGTGSWDIMADGSWNGSPAGSRPAHHNPWTKTFYTWLTPVVLSTQQTVLVRNIQTYTDVFRYNTATTNEYFLCENRQQTGFNTNIPGHGMIIYHVDGNYITSHMNSNDINSGSHQGLYPMSATSTTANGIMLSSSSTINSTGCPWPGTSNKTTFTDATIPNSKSWAGANTNDPLTTIAENTTTKEITFCFISCSTSNLSVTPPNQNVPATPAGSTTFAVTCNTTWNASSNQGWCTVTPSGTNNGTITANYTINTSVASRVATITVTASGAPNVTVTVTQAGATPTLTVIPPNQNVPAFPAGTTNFTVTSNADWTAASNQTWCIVTPSGTGNGTIVASYAVNPTTVSRIANITVTVATLTPIVVTVTQAAGAPTLTVVPPNQNVPNTPAGSTTFNVTSNTSWTTSCNAGWCTVSPGSSSGDGVITASYTENTDTNSRVATITITANGLSPVTVSVTQAAAPHTLLVTPSNQNVPASPAGSTQFNVTSNSNWTVISDQTWCTVNSSGSLNGTITASYSVNTSTSNRIANITVTESGISPIIVSVTQNGTSPTLSVTPSNQNVGYLPGTTNFTVLSNSSWTASSDSAWLSVTTAGMGNGTITTNYLQNPYYITRVATVTVTVAGLTPQAVTVTQAQSTVSVREHSTDVIRIIPNPSNGTFRLDVGEMKFTSINVSIMDISGRIIMQRECKDHADLLFNLSGSPEGSYFIRIIADSQEVTQKLILAH